MTKFRKEILPLFLALLRKLFDVREGEGVRASLMLCYIFLIISSLMILKPVCNALFLSEIGAQQLPYVFILVAVFAAAGSTFYSKLLRRIPLNALIKGTLLTASASLLVFWGLLYFHYLEGWALYAFYISVAIFAVVATSQFWILANLTFNPREAKRLFGFIGSGAIGGGIFGGYLTNLMAPILGSENLIFVCIGFWIICIMLAKRTWEETAQNRINIQVRQKEQHKKLTENPFNLILNSRHLTFLASIVGVSVLVAKLVEYQFSAIASSEIPHEDELAAFFGFWLSNLNLASLLIQLFLTRRVVGVLGVGTSLFFLPGGILFGAVAILISPALWSAVLLKIIDGSLKNSINKAGIELLSLPIPVENKNQTKTFIDVFVDSFATGVGGLILALITLGMGVSLRIVSLVIVFLIALWLYLVNRVRHEYIESFRLTLDSGEPASQPLPDLRKESVISSLISILESGNEKQIVHALRMVCEIQNERLLPCVSKLLAHPNWKIRLEALRNLNNYRSNFSGKVEKLIYDPEPEIKTEAFHYLFKHKYHSRIDMIKTYLNHRDNLIRSAVLLCVARESRNNRELKIIFNLKDLLENEIKQLHEIDDKERLNQSKAFCARIIGSANLTSLFSYLHIFLTDSSREVVQAAILAAGRSRNSDFVPLLISQLENDDLCDAVKIALKNYGPEIMDYLASKMHSEDANLKIRLAMPGLLAQIGTQSSLDILLKGLETPMPRALRDEIIRALNRMKRRFAYLKFREQPIVRNILREAEFYTRLLGALYLQTQQENDTKVKGHPDKIKAARKKLVSLLEQKLDHNLERIFRLLSIKYPPEDINTAYIGLKSKEPDLRMNAVEFLDNVLDPGLKRTIIPLVETTSLESAADELLDQIGLKDINEFEFIVMILTGHDEELKVRVLSLIGELRDERYIPFIGKLINSPDITVRNMATFALQQMDYLA